MARRARSATSPTRLNAYDANPVWTADPKRTLFRDAAKRTLTAGGLGSVGEKAATAIADFVVLDMFANVCTGREDVKERDGGRRAPGEAHLSLTLSLSERAHSAPARSIRRDRTREDRPWPP